MQPLLDFIFDFAQAGQPQNVRQWQLADTSPNDSGLWELHSVDKQSPAIASLCALQCLSIYARANLYHCNPIRLLGNWYRLWYTHPTDGFTMLALINKKRLQVVGAYRPINQFARIEQGKAWAMLGECRLKDLFVLHTVSKFDTYSSAWGDKALQYWRVLESKA